MFNSWMYLGIWLHESGVLAASPDGIVTKHSILPHVHYQNDAARHLLPDIIEVKCPYKGRNLTVVEAATGTGGFLGGLERLLTIAFRLTAHFH